MAAFDVEIDAIIAHLRANGAASAADLGRALDKSQPSISRRLRELGNRIAILGQGRNTRYGLAESILGLASLQPIHWTDESGHIERIGTLQYLAGDAVYVEMQVEAARFALVSPAKLPWPLAPLELHGFLGRARAQTLTAFGFDRNPERWTLGEQLHVNIRHIGNAPGAISIGEPRAVTPTSVPRDRRRRVAAYEAFALEVAKTLPAGSSAAGEQAKFAATIEGDGDARQVIVKFAPPRATPFGVRWSDLLHAESIALDVLREHGVAAARTQVYSTSVRTVLESIRFDRVGARGARHVVALDAIHGAFVPGARQHWAASCDALALSRRLPIEDAARVAQLRAFGHLIGNNDMHFGNLSLFVERADLARGRFRLAPVYDMLPMRWRPDTVAGLIDVLPFEPSHVVDLGDT